MNKDSTCTGVSSAFIQRTLFLACVVGLCLLAMNLVGIWLLVFGAIIVAVIIRSIADPLIDKAHMPPQIAVALSVFILLGTIAGILTVFGWQITAQLTDLSQRLPSAWERLQERLGETPFGSIIRDQLNSFGSEAGGWLKMMPRFAGTFMSGLANIVVVIVGGIVLATDPTKYRDGVVLLFPRSETDRTRESLDESGLALKHWLVAQSSSMLIVGLFTGAGLWIAGVESFLALGLMAGIAQFVPVVGPILAAGPGLLIAGSQGGDTFLWALAVYVGVSQAEANLITPLVQKKVASIPMVITLFAVIAFGALLGPIGMLFATPLTVLIYTLVMKLYVRDLLGHRREAKG